MRAVTEGLPDGTAEQDALARRLRRAGGRADDFTLVALGEAMLARAPRSAARLFDQASRIAEADGSSQRAAMAAQRAVGAWGRAGRRREARLAGERTLALLADISERHTALTVQSNVAVGLIDAGETGQAIVLLDDVISATRNVGDDIEMQRLRAAAAVNRATLAVDGRGDAPVDELLDEAESLAHRIGDGRRLGTVLINKAAWRSRQHDLAAARTLYADAARAYRAANADPADIASAIRGEAATLAAAGRLTDALDLYREARELFTAAGRIDEARQTDIGAVMARHSLGQPVPADEIEDMTGWLRDMPSLQQGMLALNLANICQGQQLLALETRLRRRAKRAFLAAGAPAEAARVDLGRAVALRRRGRLAEAMSVIEQARAVLEAENRWLSVAHADHNLALVLEEMADTQRRPRAGLRDQAADRALSAVTALDRYRHALPTAADRRALGRRTYPGMFAIALRTALLAGRNDVAAAVVERARMQPVLAEPDRPGRFADPAPIAATRNSQPVGGRGRRVILADEARRLCGPHAAWAGWWTDGRGLVATHIRGTEITSLARQLDTAALDRLHTAIAVVGQADMHAADGDPATAARLALWRTARGPLLADPTLASRIEHDLRSEVIRDLRRRTAIDEIAGLTAAELLWPLTRMLFDDQLLDDLRLSREPAERTALAIAAPPALGRLPWAALPLNDPASPSAPAAPRYLVEQADLVLAVPASLSLTLRRRATERASDQVLLIVDPTDDLPHARRLSLPDAEVLRGSQRATREQVRAALARRPGVAAISSHVRPGSNDDPAASAIILPDNQGRPTAMTVRDLGDVTAPPVCLLLGCDGAGTATGAEWTGVATGLLWAGASWVVTSTAPVVEDAVSVEVDAAVLDSVVAHGPLEGVWTWQRRCALTHRTGRKDPQAAPYRWAGFVAITTADRSDATSR